MTWHAVRAFVGLLGFAVATYGAYEWLWRSPIVLVVAGLCVLFGAGTAVKEDRERKP